MRLRIHNLRDAKFKTKIDGNQVTFNGHISYTGVWFNEDNYFLPFSAEDSNQPRVGGAKGAGVLVHHVHDPPSWDTVKQICETHDVG